MAKTTPTRPATEPTDRSIPARMIENSSPKAITLAIETWRRMLVMLPTVQKYGLAKASSTQIATVSAAT